MWSEQGKCNHLFRGSIEMKATILTPVVCLLACLCLLSGCGGGKYDDVKKTNAEFVTATQAYIAGLDKASNGKEAAKVINSYADAMERLAPKMKKLAEKYPELKDPNNPPEELKEVMKKSEEVGTKMGSSMMKLMAYMDDPDVKKAQERMGAAMMKMQ